MKITLPVEASADSQSINDLFTKSGMFSGDFKLTHTPFMVFRQTGDDITLVEIAQQLGYTFDPETL